MELKIECRAFKANGVSQANHDKEISLNLWQIEITLVEAQRVANWYCNYYDLPHIKVITGRGRQRKGAYVPESSTWNISTPAVIKIDQDGYFMAVIVHEMAHHYEASIYHRTGHGPRFKQMHSMMLNKVQEMMKGMVWKS